MAPWEELILTCNLKGDVPNQVIDTLNYLIAVPVFDFASLKFEPYPTPDHHFFHDNDYHWQDLFGGATSYFPGEPFVRFSDDRYLTMRTLVRSGDMLVRGFLDWLAPYSETEGIVGYTRCDETPDSADLIWFEKGTVYYFSIALYNDPPTVKQVKITKSDSAANSE